MSGLPWGRRYLMCPPEHFEVLYEINTWMSVEVALMLASTLHAIATGNILPAGVETYCVDINQAVVTKLADRGSHQALGIVTDVGLFLRDLVEHLSRG